MLTEEQREWLIALGVLLAGGSADGASTAVAPAKQGQPVGPQHRGSATLSASSATARVLQKISVDPIQALMAVGEKLQFSAAGDYDDGTSEILTDEVDWSSSSDVVSIAHGGLAQAERQPNASGPQTITATLEKVSGSAQVTVASLESMMIEPLKPKVAGGNELSFKAMGEFSDGQRRAVTTGIEWSTSAEDVVEIDRHSGVAKARRVNNTAIITATSTGGRFTSSTSVTVATAELRSIKISPARPQSAVGQSVQFTATGVYSDGSTQDETHAVAWTSAPPGVVSVDDSVGARGLATAGANPGIAKITATDPNNPKVTDTVSIEVIPGQLSNAPDPKAVRKADQDDAHAKGMADGKAGTHAKKQALTDKGEPGLGGRLAAYEAGWKEGRKAQGALPLDGHIEQLVQETQIELAEDDVPEYWLLLDSSGYASIIEPYKAVREQLADYLKNVDPKNSTEKELGASVVGAWKGAIKEAGQLRRSLAKSLVLRWDQPIREEQKRLDQLKGELQVLRGKHKRIEEDLEQGEHAMDLITLVLQVGDAAEMAEKAAESVHEKMTKAAMVVAGAKIVSQSQIIEKSIENLIQSYSQLTLVAEGFASMQELDRALETKVEAVHKSVEELAQLKGHQERAESNASISVMEDPDSSGWATSR